MKKFVIFTIVCTLMGAWTTAQAANYDLWVGGTQVTDANKGDVLGDGKVSYDPATLTLALSNGASVAGTGLQSQAATGYGNGIYSLVNGLTIAVEGTVTVSASTSNTAFNGIYLDGNTTITGNGLLTVTGSTAVRLYSSAEKLTVSGQVELAAEGDVSGLKGYYRQRTLSLARSTLIVKDKAMVRAKGSSYTFDGWKELVLEDDHAITLPVGATWNAPKMTVCDAGGNVVADTWVFIASESVGYLGFAIGNVLITKENYAEYGGGGKWSYDAEANVLHLNDGVIDPNGHSGLIIRGDLNPTLNISVDGKFSLSGVFTLGLVFTGNGTHTVYGKGTLNIEPRVIQPTSVAASGGKPNVTFKDLTVNVRQYGGVGFNNADFGSITFDWCDFIINTSDGFGLFGGMKATKPKMILCGDVNHSYGWDDNRGGGIKGNGEDEGLFASNVAIRRKVKYLNVAIDEPVPGQKPATTARALSPAYKVTQISWWEVDGASGGLKNLSNDAVFEDNKAYFIEMGIEATGDSIISLLPENEAYRVFTVNGKVGERFGVRNSGATAVIEGAGDHCCEYMTGGRVVVLGEVGRNFAAGMSGGVAYVWDKNHNFDYFCNMDMVEINLVEESAYRKELMELVRKHYLYTGSALAGRMLDNWNQYVGEFVQVVPIEYKRVLEEEKMLRLQKKIADLQRDY